MTLSSLQRWHLELLVYNKSTAVTRSRNEYDHYLVDAVVFKGQEHGRWLDEETANVDEVQLLKHTQQRGQLGMEPLITLHLLTHTQTTWPFRSGETPLFRLLKRTQATWPFMYGNTHFLTLSLLFFASKKPSMQSRTHARTPPHPTHTHTEFYEAKKRHTDWEPP